MTPHRAHSGLAGCSNPHLGQIMPAIPPLVGVVARPDSISRGCAAPSWTMTCAPDRRPGGRRASIILVHRMLARGQEEGPPAGEEEGAVRLDPPRRAGDQAERGPGAGEPLRQELALRVHR